MHVSLDIVQHCDSASGTPPRYAFVKTLKADPKMGFVKHNIMTASMEQESVRQCDPGIYAA